MIKDISYIDAIQSLDNTLNCTINNDDLDNIIWIGETPNITKQQILDEQARLQAIEYSKPEHTAKVSGNQKLLDLGLSQAEATALTGYTPPVAE